MDSINTDYLVIGAGVAGLRAAIELANSGDVLVVAKESLRESASEYAQGGIAVALSDDDEVSLHEQDTLYAGDGLCDVAAVRTLVEEGPHAIQELIEWGTEFDRDGTRLLFTREGAHSRNRILHAHGDSTGREIARTLYWKAASLSNVQFRSFAGMTDLLLDDNGCAAGAIVLNQETGLRLAIHAKAVLLATGGLGHVYLETTNPDVATGDGVAAAFRAGAEIRDIEFVQFHPTALHMQGAPRFLLSEALRGEGAYLRNQAGERFMDRYHEMGELAPRDVVSRSIVAETIRTGTEHAYLDLTHRTDLDIAQRFPRIFETCMHYGIDLRTQSAPVYPAVHYSMGGVYTDLHGRTTVPNLFAAGEVAATGVHGANRLASNSLLEGIVYGARTGKAMRDVRPASAPRVNGEKVAKFPDATEVELRTLAWTACGVQRNAKDLQAAKDKLAAMECATLDDPSRQDYEVRNIHTVTQLIAACALAREESRGGHYRTDFPQKDPRFEKHSTITRRGTVRFV
ncbi:L-aspartate oxidase [Bryobacterales bacterium F-183]|nr:L-aspartate oxidase [Bryobacterales bacterium F-183]